MKIRNAIILLIVLAFSISLLAGCKQTPITPPPVSEKSCVTDSDCACGTHKSTGECFFGNKAFVNVEKQCPDFCTGIAAMFETKCVNKECKQVRIQKTQCSKDSDCAPEQCCHATSCIPVGQKGVCNLACTNICQPETMDCGGFCACEAGKCTTHLNDLKANDTTPVQIACTTDDDCVPADCCHANTCVTKDKQPDCASIMCSQECVGQTMDCGGFCACQNGKCVAELNDL